MQYYFDKYSAVTRYKESGWVDSRDTITKRCSHSTDEDGDDDFRSPKPQSYNFNYITGTFSSQYIPREEDENILEGYKYYNITNGLHNIICHTALTTCRHSGQRGKKKCGGAKCSIQTNYATSYDQVDALIQSNIVAEENTYPSNGKHSDGYWYIKRNLVWTPPNLQVKVDGQIRQYSDGWVRVNGQLRQIDKIFIKVNGELKEV